jgi:hypothetical protein
VAESKYISEEMEQHPGGECLADLSILRRFVYNDSFGHRESKDTVFQGLKTRYREVE